MRGVVIGTIFAIIVLLFGTGFGYLISNASDWCITTEMDDLSKLLVCVGGGIALVVLTLTLTYLFIRAIDNDMK